MRKHGIKLIKQSIASDIHTIQWSKDCLKNDNNSKENINEYLDIIHRAKRDIKIARNVLDVINGVSINNFSLEMRYLQNYKRSKQYSTGYWVLEIEKGNGNIEYMKKEVKKHIKDYRALDVIYNEIMNIINKELFK